MPRLKSSWLALDSFDLVKFSFVSLPHACVQVILMQCHSFRYAVQHACLLFERCVHLLAEAGLAEPISERQSLLYEPPQVQAQRQQQQQPQGPSTQPGTSTQTRSQAQAQANGSAPFTSQQQAQAQAAAPPPPAPAPLKKLTAPAEYNSYAPLALILATEKVSPGH